MATMTIAQLVAVLSADTTALDSRLAKVESKFDHVAKESDKMAETINKNFVSASKGSDTYVKSLEKVQRGEANLAKYQYETGAKSAADYKAFLRERMNAYESHTSQWKAAATQLATMQKAETAEQQKQITEITRANEKAVAANIAGQKQQARETLKTQKQLDADLERQRKQQLKEQEKNAREAVRIQEKAQRDIVRAQEKADKERVASNEKAQKDTDRANKKAVADANKLYKQQVADKELADKQMEESTFNRTRLEYDQNMIAAADYKKYLEQRMASYAEYTAQWKASAAELVALQRDMDRKPGGGGSGGGGKASRVGGVLNGLGAGAAAITGVEALSAGVFSDFQRKTVAVSNNSIMDDATLKAMQEGIKKLAVGSGSSLDDLADGFMRATNEGYKTTDALKILDIANKEAVSTMASVNDTTTDLATTLRVYGIEADKAKNVMSALDQAAAKGNSTIGDWVKNTTRANAIAGSLDLSLADTNSALSALTRHGFNTSEADTQVYNMISHIASPTKAVLDIIKDLQPRAKALGIDLDKDFSVAGIKAKGLHGVLMDIKKVTGGNASAVFGAMGLVPTQRGGLGAMVLITKAAKDYDDILKDVSAQLQGIAKINPIDQGTARMMDTPTQKWAVLARTIEVEFLPVGEKATKIFVQMEPVLMKLADATLAVMNLFQKLPEPVQTAITVIGGFFIISKVTGFLTALTKIPVAFRAIGLAGVKLWDIVSVIGKAGTATTELATGMGTAETAAVSMGSAIGSAVAIVGGLVAGVLALVNVSKDLYDIYVNKDWHNPTIDKPVTLLSDPANFLMRKIVGMPTSVDANGNAGSAAFSPSQLRGLASHVKGVYVPPAGLGPLPVRGVIPGAGGGLADIPDAKDGGVTRQTILDAEAKRKAAQAAAKRKEAEARSLQKSYDNEQRSLQKIITLKGEDADLDNKHTHLLKAQFDLSAEGTLANIKGQQAQALLAEAAQADLAERNNKIALIIKHMKEADFLLSQPKNVAKAIGEVGGVANWRALGNVGKRGADGFSESQKQILDAVKRYSINDELRKTKDLLDNLTLAQKIGGDVVKQAAVDAAGGAVNWKALSDAMKITWINTERAVMSQTEIKNLTDAWDKKLEESSLGPNRTNAEDADIAIADIARKLGISEKDKRFQGIRDSATFTDTNEQTSFLEKQNRDLDNRATQFTEKTAKHYDPTGINAGQAAIEQWEKDNYDMEERIKRTHDKYELEQLDSFKERLRQQAEAEEKFEASEFIRKAENETIAGYNELGTALADAYDPATKAVHEWERANAEALKRLRADWGDIADSAIKAYEEELKAYTIGKDTTDLNLQTQQLNDKTNRDIAERSNLDITPGDKAVSQWEDNNQILIKELGATSDAVTKYEEALRKNADAEDELAKAQARRQAIVESLSQGIMNGIQNALSPSVDARQSLMEKLNSQKETQFQDKIGQAQFHNQYPNDPNDPYIQRLKDIQKQIDITDRKLHDMGSNLVSVFRRFFDSIYISFKQTLVKIAQEYIQSQLLSYLTRQVGSGAGFAVGGKPSVVGSVLGVLGTVLGGMVGGGGKGGGAVGSAPTPLPSLPASASTYFAASGGMIIPNAPTWVGDKGEPELIVPSGPGMIIPASRLRGGRSGSGSTMVVNNTNVSMNISTPDVRGFTQSRASLVQDMTKAMRQRR